MYIGAALSHQQLPRTSSPRVQGQPLRCIIETMPTPGQLGENAGRHLAARWTFEACREWLANEERRWNDDPRDETGDQYEYRVGVRLGVAERMAAKGEESAR